MLAILPVELGRVALGQKSRLAGIDAVADHSRIFYDGVNAVCG